MVSVYGQKNWEQFVKNYYNMYDAVISTAKKMHNRRLMLKSYNKIKTAWEIIKANLTVDIGKRIYR